MAMRTCRRLALLTARQQPVRGSGGPRAFADASGSLAATATLREVPGPPPLPLLGNFHNFDLNQIMTGNVRPLYAAHGPIVQVSLAGKRLVFLSDVDMAKEILQKRASDFTNSDTFRSVFGHFFPKSVIVLEGDEWKRIRRILQRALQQTRVADLVQPLHKVIDRGDASSIRTGEACDVHHLFSNIAFDGFGIWALGVDMETHKNGELLEACNELANALPYNMNKRPFPILWSLPTSYNRRVGSALRTMKDHATRLLGAAQARLEKGTETESQSNVLDAMVRASLAEEDAKQRLTAEESVDNLCTIFFGAYDTTAATLSFTLHFLAENAAVQDELATELADVNLAEISQEKLEALPILDNVTKEANRLRSTAWGFGRTAKVDTEVGGYHIHKGTNVVIDHVGLTARDPALWGQQQDLDDFRPSRWQEVSPPRLASLPFGFGTRMCIGKQVATVNQKLATAVLVQRYRWRTDPSRPLELTTGVGLQPKGGCWLVPDRRCA